MRTVSVVVPVYNSAESLPSLIKRLQPVLKECAPGGYELILVNDYSSDNSAQVMGRLAAENRWVRTFNLSRNFGQHNAILCGLHRARYETTVTMDDDLQHPPEEIPKLLAKLDEGYDVVYGSPDQERHGLFRDLASQITKVALQASMGVKTARSVSAFRVLRTPIRRAFSDYKSPFVSIDVLLTWGTSRFATVRVRHEERTIGSSNYSFRKLMTHSLNMMTGFSTLPLQLASIVGFVFTIFGAVVLAYVFTQYFRHGTPVQGFPFLASSIAIFSGAQLFSIGIIGEYLSRMYVRTMGKPVYLTREPDETPSPRERD